jgi:hypothetical protein
VALITGAIASTILTLVVVPGIYFLMKRGSEGSDGEGPATEPAPRPEPEPELAGAPS